MSAETPAPAGMGPREKMIYRALTIAVMVALAFGGFWAFGTYVKYQVEQRLRDAKPIYTLECRPKGE